MRDEIRVEIRDEIKEFLEKDGVIFPGVFATEIYSQILKVAGPFSGLMRVVAKQAGKAAAKSLMNSASISKDDIPEILWNMFSLTRFADVNIEVDGNTMKIHFIDSFMLKAHNDPKKSLSPFVGAVEGFVEEILGKEVKATLEGKTIILDFS